MPPMNLPAYKKGKGELYGPKPPVRGDYVVNSGDLGTITARWDGENWTRAGNRIRAKELYEVWGPIPGTELPAPPPPPVDTAWAEWCSENGTNNPDIEIGFRAGWRACVEMLKPPPPPY